MRKIHLLNLVYACFWLLSALAILVRVYSLRFNPPESPVLFWLPYMIFIILSGLIVLIREDTFPLLVTLGMSIVLHSILFLRAPTDTIYEIDAVGNLQVANMIKEIGHLTPGFRGFTLLAYGSSYYPGLELFMCSLNMLSGIPLRVLYKYAFAGINVITILTLYFIMKMFVKNRKTLNLSVFLYALCPRFHGFDSSAVHESLALIFFPLLISVFLTRQCKLFSSQKFLAVLLISAALLSITHHFTMYVLIFQAIFIVAGMYISKRKVSPAQIGMLLLLTVFLFSWQIFTAIHFIYTHGSLTVSVLQSLFLTNVNQAREPLTAYSMAILERNLTYVGVGLLLLTSAIGAYEISRRKNGKYIKSIENGGLILWWVISAGMIGLFEIIPWRAIDPAIRFRGLEFAYFGIILFSAVGVQKILNLGNNSFITWFKLKRLTGIVSLFILLLISVPTVLIGFQYFVYDNPPPKSTYYQSPVESRFSFIWLFTYSTSDRVIGTAGGRHEMNNYALKNWSESLFFDSVKNRWIYNGPYWVEKANLIFPDPSNIKLEADQMLWLNSYLNRIYDSEAIMIFIPENYRK